MWNGVNNFFCAVYPRRRWWRCGTDCALLSRPPPPNKSWWSWSKGAPCQNHNAAEILWCQAQRRSVTCSIYISSGILDSQTQLPLLLLLLANAATSAKPTRHCGFSIHRVIDQHKLWRLRQNPARLSKVWWPGRLQRHRMNERAIKMFSELRGRQIIAWQTRTTLLQSCESALKTSTVEHAQRSTERSRRAETASKNDERARVWVKRVHGDPSASHEAVACSTPRWDLSLRASRP